MDRIRVCKQWGIVIWSVVNTYKKRISYHTKIKEAVSDWTLNNCWFIISGDSPCVCKMLNNTELSHHQLLWTSLFYPCHQTVDSGHREGFSSVVTTSLHLTILRRLRRVPIIGRTIASFTFHVAGGCCWCWCWCWAGCSQTPISAIMQSVHCNLVNTT